MKGVYSFKTLQVFRSWSADVHIVWIQSSDYYLLLFLQNELSHFPIQNEYILGILCMQLLQQLYEGTFVTLQV